MAPDREKESERESHARLLSAFLSPSSVPGLLIVRTRNPRHPNSWAESATVPVFFRVATAAAASTASTAVNDDDDDDMENV